MNLLDKLKLLEYYYEPINDKQYLYIKDNVVFLCVGNKHTLSSLEEAVQVFDEKKIYIVDHSLTIQALHHKKKAEKLMQVVGIDWQMLTEMEENFKQAIMGIVAKHVDKKHLNLVEDM